MDQKLKAKFTIQQILPIALILVAAGIGLTYGIDVVTDVRDDYTADTLEYNASKDTLTGLAKFPAKMPLIATVLIAAILIGILIRYMMAR